MNYRDFRPFDHKFDSYLIEKCQKTLTDHKTQDQSGPIVIEIGCGVGFHPILWAKENPTGLMLAIERTRDKFIKFETRLNHHPEIKNVIAAHAEASVLLPQIIKPLSVDQIYILYPNPEPKQKNKRWSHSIFSQFIFEILKPGGEIVFATNVKSYATEMAHVWPQRFKTDLIQHTPIDSYGTKPRSHFEKKYLARGEVCWNLIFRKLLI